MPGCSDYPLSALLDPRSPAWIAVFCWMLAAGASARADTGDLPPTGRSLFDIITTAPTPEGPRLKVPYPFSRLRALILDKGGLGDGDIAETLIPIGRSLQREAAGPDYFSSPRRLLAVIAEPRTAAPETRPLLKDRLYLGYQPKAEAIEVISFNEDADRFEFQIVENYAPGKTPRVVQARRALCLACHGNGGPIFSKEPWSETPANPEVAARRGRCAPVTGRRRASSCGSGAAPGGRRREPPAARVAILVPHLHRVQIQARLPDEHPVDDPRTPSRRPPAVREGRLPDPAVHRDSAQGSSGSRLAVRLSNGRPLSRG